MSAVVINLTADWKSSWNSDYVTKNEERIKLTYMQKASKKERKKERKRKREREKKKERENKLLCSLELHTLSAAWSTVL